MLSTLKSIALMLFVVVFLGPPLLAQDVSQKRKTVDEVIAIVKAKCGTCHNIPSPNLLPKKNWPRVVDTMRDLTNNRMGREFITAEDARDITAFYYGNSPEKLPMLPYSPDTAAARGFTLTASAKKSKVPLVINVHAVDLSKNGGTELLVCDAENNQVLLVDQADGHWRERVLAEVQIPVHTEVVDFDKDGDNDIIVAALGGFPPSEKLVGEVILLRQSSSGQFEKEVLLNGVGRVTDARPVDIDGDGDLDVAVAIFGGGIVGELIWLENTGKGKYVRHGLLGLSGALNISPIDLNGDGKMDFVSLFAQEHEMIVGLINKGGGQFENVKIGKAPHPMLGSTGMKLADIDSDGDVDILFSNGDAHDLQTDPKPYHGVQWYENTGNLKFTYHNIGRFYGTATAEAGDMDGDGDIDIVAASWLNYWDDPKRQTLVWYENDGKQNFSRHNIMSRPHSIVSMELKDVTGDNQLDIIATIFRTDLMIKRLFAKGRQRQVENTNEDDQALFVDEPLIDRLIILENQSIRAEPTAPH